MLLAAAAAARPRAGAACGAGFWRTFKTKASERAAKAAQVKAEEKAHGGRDPYGLFKSAMASVPKAEAKHARPRHAEWQAHRAAYSRAKMLEHHRVAGHFSKMIAAREAALGALPAGLQAEAREPDYSLVPIERRVFTETAPIHDFQDKLIRAASDGT